MLGGCLGQEAEGLKGGARSLALITALSLGGKAFGHERNSQDVANVDSGESVDVDGNRGDAGLRVTHFLQSNF